MSGAAARLAIAALAALLASPLPGAELATGEPQPAILAAAASPGTAADPHASIPSPQALMGRLPSQEASPLRTRGLAELGAWLGLPELTPTAEERERIDGLQARIAAEPVPLEGALAAWAAAIGTAPPTPGEPAVAQALALPHAVQVPLAVLLHAMAEATLLQRQAVAGVAPADYARLLQAAADVANGGLDPAAPGGAAAVARLGAAAGDVDRLALAKATRTVAAALDATGPALRSAVAPSPGAVPPTAQGHVQAFLAAHPPEGAARQPLAAAAGAVRLAAGLAGLEGLSVPAPRIPDPAHPLAAAVAEWAALAGLPWQAVAPQLAQADGLPAPLQQALASVLLAAADWQRQVLALSLPSEPGGPLAQRQASLLGAQMALLQATDAAAPTLEAWGLAWSHGGAGVLPATPAHAPAALAAANAFANGAFGRDLRHVLALASPGLSAPEPAPATSTGPLADAVLALHALQGAPDGPEAEAQLRAAADVLPPLVDTAAARILWAEVAAIRSLQAVAATVTPDEAALLAAGPDPAWFSGPVSSDDLQRMRALYGAADRIQAAYLASAAAIAQAIDQSTAELRAAAGRGYMDEAPRPRQEQGWLARAGRFLGSWPIASARAQDPVVPSDAVCGTAARSNGFSDCANNIWFRTGGVLILGPGTSRVDLATPASNAPAAAGVGATTLQLDLGGDDEYRNNAGGSGYTAQLGTVSYSPVPPPNNAPVVAVSLDLGGNDRYLVPTGTALALTPGSGTARTDFRAPDDLQGASQGGIGMLVDVDGDDRYEARRMSQGYARGYTATDQLPSYTPSRCVTCVVLTSVGILLDQAGNDVYQATSLSQGAAEAGYTIANIDLASTLGVSTAAALLRDSVPMRHSIPHPITPLGALLDSGGDDQYRLAPVLEPLVGQGGAQVGVGLLADGGGDDTYRYGMQGSSEGAGVGVLADLGGDDSYTRRPTHAFHDDVCWAGARTPRGTILAPQGLSPLARDVLPAVEAFGVFLDTQGPAGCAVATDHLRLDGIPTAGHADDADGDGWADFLEAYSLGSGGTDDGAPTDYPAGLPDGAATCVLLAGPDGPCDELPPATPGDGAPFGSSYLVRIPGLLALGDAVANDHAPSTAADPGRDYAVLLDLAGHDVYRNRAGGAAALLPAPATWDPSVARLMRIAGPASSAASPFASLTLDVGGDDSYQSQASCVQGCNGLLVELAGDDTYQASGGGGGACPCLAHGGTAASLPGMASMLLDAAGDDRYLRTTLRPETGVADVGQGAVTDTLGGVGILLDVAGNDTYRSPTQGFADSRDWIVRPRESGSVVQPDQGLGAGSSAALFLDLDGHDRYSPVGRQGTVDSRPQPFTTPVAAAGAQQHKAGTALFLDAAGDDAYQGSVEDPAGTDHAGHLNNRLRASADGASLGVFWDQDRGATPPPADASVLADPADAIDLRRLGIAIGTTANDAYDVDYALVYDPAGDDTYRNNAGATLLRGRVAAAGTALQATLDPMQAYPVAAVLVDAAGHDTYAARDARAVHLGPLGVPPTPAAALGLANPGDPRAAVAAMLPSANGILAQGAGLLGVGALLDAAGDDRYLARGLAQGASLLGAGLLVDRAGDDLHSIDPVVARRPVASGRGVVWEELAQGEWRLRARFGESPVVCPLTSPAATGPATGADLHVLDQDGGQSRLAYSQYDADLGVWRLAIALPDLDTCPDAPASVPYATVVASNQLHPALADEDVIWQDDRGGDADLYLRSITDPPTATHDLPLVALPGNQTRPDAHGTWLVWQDDRDGAGASAIHLLNLRTPSLSARVSPPQPAQGVRQDVDPRVSDTRITWQTRTCAASLASCDPWQVVVVNRQVAGGAPCTFGSAAGDLVAPDVAGDDVVAWSPGQGAIVRLAWSPGCAQGPQTLHEDAAQPSLDRQAADQLAWMSTVPPTLPNEEAALRPAGSPYLEVLRGTLSPSLPRAASRLDLRMDERVQQGAAFLGGLGLLLDEAGNDRFVAAQHSQGASVGLGTAKPATGPHQDRLDTTPGAHGVLVSLAGNDAFTALRHSQGADLTATLRHMAKVPPPTPVQVADPTPVGYLEGAENAGLLLTVRGSNVYTANERSQGYAALAAGVLTSSPRPAPPGGDPETDPAQAYGVASVGALLDLGGRDAYLANLVHPTRVTCLELGDGLSPGLDAALEAQCPAAMPPGPTGNNEIVLQGAQRVDPNGDRCSAAPPFACAQTCAPSGGGPGVQAPQPCEHVLGGVRADLPAFDHSDAAVRDQANERLLDVSVKAFEGGRDLLGDAQSPGLGGRGELRLQARVQPRSDGGAVAVEAVEFYLGAQFLGYGRAVGPGTYEVGFDSATPRTPDAPSYEVSARALFRAGATAGLQNTPLGYADGFLRLRIDNPTRLVAPTLQRDPACGSPCPFAPDPWAPGSPPPPTLSFGLIPDVEGERRGYATVSVRDAAGNAVADLRPAGVLGPGAWPVGAGSVQVTWDGVLQSGPAAGEVAPPGIYRLALRVADQLEPGSPEPALHAGRIVAAPDFLLRVDSRAPEGGCVIVLRTGDQPPSGCNPLMSVHTGNSDAGRTQTRVPLRLDYDRASSPSPGSFHLFRAEPRADGSTPPAAEWVPVPLQGSSALLTLPHGSSVLLAVLVQDASGNLECSRRCAGADHARSDTLVQALGRKLAAPTLGDPAGSRSFARLDVDIGRPELILGNAGLPVRVDGRDYPVEAIPRAGPHSEVAIRWLATGVPPETPTARLRWTSLGAVDPGEDAPCFTSTYDPVALTPVAGGEPGLFQATWSDWEGLLEPRPGCPSWPEGGIAWTLDVFDPAGNQASPNVGGLVVLDLSPPAIQDASDGVTYPDGRLHAIRDDALVLTLRATDPVVSPLPALAPNQLTVALDASPLVDPAAISASLAATMQAAAQRHVPPCQTAPPEHPGLVDFLFCYSAEARAYQARVPFQPRPGLDPELLEAAPFTLPFNVTDPVGNRAEGSFLVAVGRPNIGILPVRAIPGVGSADVRVYTVKPALGTLMAGPEADALAPVGSTPAGHLHQFHLDDLEPGSTVVLRFIATDPASGAREASPLASFRVLQGVHAAVTQPAAGAVLSGLADVKVAAGVSARPGVDPNVRIALVRADGLEPAVPLFEGPAIGGAATLRLVTDARSDGLYELRASAVHEGELANAPPVLVRIDNTAPGLRQVVPAQDAVVRAAPPALLLRATDEDAGFCPATPCTLEAEVRAGAARTAVAATFHRDAAGNGGLVEVPLPAGLGDGPARVHVTLADAAGNPATLAARFLVDPDAPAVAAITVTYPPGQEAVRPGQPVGILVGYQDASGIAVATADLRPAKGPPAVRLQPSALGHTVQVLVPDDAAPGLLRIPLQAADAAGNVRASEALVLVDADPPQVASLSGKPAGADTLRLSVNATEPVRLAVTVSHGGTPWRHVATQAFSAQAQVAVTGLLPGHEYDVAVVATDRAGHEARSDASLRFAPVVLPAPLPGGLAARGSPAGVHLQWTPPLEPAAFRFRVLRADGDGPLAQLAETAGSSHLDATARPGAAYRYAVQAVNLAGEAGPVSAIVNATAGSGPAVEPSVTPRLGRAGQTPFVFRAALQGAHDERPRAWLHVDGRTYALDRIDGDCRAACTMSRALTLPALDLRQTEVRYAVEVLDGGLLVRGPAEGTLPGPEVVGTPGGALQEPGLPVPAPGAAALLLLLALCLALARLRRTA